LTAQGDVTSDGFLVTPGITVPATAFRFHRTVGTVSVLQAGQAETSEFGQIELARLLNRRLHSIGGIFTFNLIFGEPITGTPGSLVSVQPTHGIFRRCPM
jgi:flagellar basal-body rod protein FlgG